MAKVEGSNPFIRLDQNPRECGGFVLSGTAADKSHVIVGSTRG
jgi:hypothetical protein